LPVRPPYDLLRTLRCGQAFGWEVDGTGATGLVSGRVVRVQQTSNAIIVEGLAEEPALRSLRRYLGLDEPLADIERALATDRVLRRVLPHSSGTALMRQDPWECLVSFIISAFNNIPKIELSLKDLARRFGTRAAGSIWTFPTPERLAGARLWELRHCALGYRAPYVREVARLVASGKVDLDRLDRTETDDARRILLALPGVGEKVADCMLLYAYGRGDAFPIDVWIKRAVERWYFNGRPKTEHQIREFARRRFGPLAGYAQQHLFLYARSVAGRSLRVRRGKPRGNRASSLRDAKRPSHLLAEGTA